MFAIWETFHALVAHLRLKYLLMILAFAGDSAITKFLPI